MSAHVTTQGPWRIDSKFVVGPVSTEDDQSRGFVIGVADVYGENREADARLIAAAPQMLEALKAVADAKMPGEARRIALEALRIASPSTDDGGRGE